MLQIGRLLFVIGWVQIAAPTSAQPPPEAEVGCTRSAPTLERKVTEEVKSAAHGYRLVGVPQEVQTLHEMKFWNDSWTVTVQDALKPLLRPLWPGPQAVFRGCVSEWRFRFKSPDGSMVEATCLAGVFLPDRGEPSFHLSHCGRYTLDPALASLLEGVRSR